MKKIGIVTFHRAENYGAVLQAYALQQVIKKNQFDCEIIDYRDESIQRPYRLLYIRNKDFLRNIKDILMSILFFNKNLKRKINFKKFFKHMTLSKKALNPNQIGEYDIYITGSDQVWNTDIVGNLSDIYTLNFLKDNSKKISYAASIGKNAIDKRFIEDFRNKISKINKISVREKEAKMELLKIIKNKEIEVVLDPTLLLDENEWENILNKFNLKSTEQDDILAYYVSPEPEFFKITNELSRKTGLKIIHFGISNKGFNNVYRNVYGENPIEFLNLIKNAKYVVGTSFHATVFSIIFEKKFFVIPHKKTSSRITNLLDKLELSERIINNIDEFNDFNKKINYEAVKLKLKTERKKSLDWLNNAINS